MFFSHSVLPKNVHLGESGSGKSNLLNLILSTPGEQNVVFPEGEGAEACTLQPQVVKQ